MRHERSVKRVHDVLSASGSAMILGFAPRPSANPLHFDLRWDPSSYKYNHWLLRFVPDPGVVHHGV